MRHTAPCLVVALLSALAVSLTSCEGAGLYDHAVRYVPLPGEEAAAKGARDYDPVTVHTQPEMWRDVPVSLFGVVVGRTPGPGGAAYVTMTIRRLEPRNLCEYAADEASCRTTVSDRDFGLVHAVVALRHEDDIGEHSLGSGSLLRIVGPLSQESDPSDGNPVVRATFYRHWPRYFFVTRSAAASMRQ